MSIEQQVLELQQQLAVLYHNNDPHAKTAANQWLSEFQKEVSLFSLVWFCDRHPLKVFVFYVFIYGTVSLRTALVGLSFDTGVALDGAMMRLAGGLDSRGEIA